MMMFSSREVVEQPHSKAVKRSETFYLKGLPSSVAKLFCDWRRKTLEVETSHCNCIIAQQRPCSVEYRSMSLYHITIMRVFDCYIRMYVRTCVRTYVCAYSLKHNVKYQSYIHGSVILLADYSSMYSAVSVLEVSLMVPFFLSTAAQGEGRQSDKRIFYWECCTSFNSTRSYVHTHLHSKAWTLYHISTCVRCVLCIILCLSTAPAVFRRVLGVSCSPC